MGQSQYEKYIIRDLVLPSHPHPEVTRPVLALRGGERGGLNFRLSWWAITQPFEMLSETMVHDFDQFLIFLGGDLTNMLDLGGEVELTLGEEDRELEKFVFTTATMVYVPAGLRHCPLNFKKVDDPKKPILFQDLFFSPEYKKTVVE